MRKQYRPSGWQLDAANLHTQNVQVWRNGLMAGVISKQQAVEMIAEGNAFVICEQAVGIMIDGVSVA